MRINTPGKVLSSDIKQIILRKSIATKIIFVILIIELEEKKKKINYIMRN